MVRSKPILIACPQHGAIVRGTCECDESGAYRRADDGTFSLRHVHCSQNGGRCMETLCALHRYNRRGPGTWYPDRILAVPEPAGRRRRRSAERESDGGDSTISVQA